MQTQLSETHQQQPVTGVLVAIALGALLGTTARFAIGTTLPGAGPSMFPLGTLLVNLIGCGLIGIAQTLFKARQLRHARLLQPGITVGLLGGFTTFSTFSVETIRLIQSGYVWHALAYQSLSLIGGLGSVVLGIAVGQRLSVARVQEQNQ